MTYEEKVLKEFDVEFGKLYDIEQLKIIEELNKKNGTDFIAYPRNEKLKKFISSALKKQRGELLGCLQKKVNLDDIDNLQFSIDRVIAKGFNQCRKEFLNNLKEKGL
jgi:hypothetical protein